MGKHASGSVWSELNVAAEVVEAAHEAQYGLGAIAAREVIGAEVAIFNAVFKHVPDGGEHRGGDGEDGFLGAATSPQAQELGLQVGVFDTYRGPGGRDERGLEPRGAFAGTRGAAFAGAFVVPGAHRGPGEQVRGGGEARHVGADLRQYHLGGELTHP